MGAIRSEEAAGFIFFSYIVTDDFTILIIDKAGIESMGAVLKVLFRILLPWCNFVLHFVILCGSRV